MKVEIDIQEFMAWLRDREVAFGNAAIPLIKKYLDQQLQQVPYSCQIINEVQTL